jgi:hypothetical protein
MHISDSQTSSPKMIAGPRGQEERAKVLVVFRRRNTLVFYLNPNILSLNANLEMLLIG